MSEEIMETANILLTFLGDENHVNQIFYFLYGREDYAIKKKVDLQFILPKMMWELQEKCRSERALRKQYSSEVRINRSGDREVRAQYKRYKTKINDLQTDRIDLQTEIIDLRTGRVDLQTEILDLRKKLSDERSHSIQMVMLGLENDKKWREKMDAFRRFIWYITVFIAMLILHWKYC